MWGRSCHGAVVKSWVWRRRHERGAEALLHHCSCVAVVRRGTSGRRAGGGGVGADDVICRMVTRSIRAVHCASSRALGRARDPTPTLCRRRSFSRTAPRSATCAAQGLGGHAFRSSQPVRWAFFFNQRALRHPKRSERSASRFSISRRGDLLGSRKRPSSMLLASPATSSLPLLRGSRSAFSCQLNMLWILAASLLRFRRLCRRRRVRARAARKGSQAPPATRNFVVVRPPKPPSPPTPRGGRGPGRGGAKSYRESKKSQSAERSGAAASDAVKRGAVDQGHSAATDRTQVLDDEPR